MIIGAQYLLVGEDLQVLRDGFIEVNDEGVIIRIGKGTPRDYDIFYESSVIFPSFIDSHTHVADSIAREKAYGHDIFESVVGEKSIKFKALREATEEELIRAIRTSIKEMISRGITAFIDYREGGLGGIRLLRKALTGSERAIILGRPDGGDPERVLKISDGFGLSSLNKYTDYDLNLLRNLTNRYNKLFSAHVSETLSQRAKSLGRYGKTDVVRALDVGIDMLVHLTYATEGELYLIKKEGKLVVFCPRANTYLGLEFPPIHLALRMGLEFAIGTDNVMLNMPDLFREFDFIVRMLRKRGITIPPKLLLKSATTIPSRKLNLRFGVLKEGMFADFVVFDLNKPNVYCVGDIYKAIVLRGEAQNIKAVYVSGRRVFERRE